MNINNLLRAKRQWSGRFFISLVILFLSLWAIQACDPKASDREIKLYCFSAMQDVMLEGIIPAFQENQRLQHQTPSTIKTNFMGSAELTSHLITRESADIAILASEIDAMRLVYRGSLDQPLWRDSPYSGIVVRSPILIVTDPEQGLDIQDFADLSNPTTQLIHANPIYSGLGQWSLLATYGAFLGDYGSDDLAMEALQRLWSRVTLNPASAMLARAQYGQKRGNTMLTYESEILGAGGSTGMPGEVRIPHATILAEPVVVLIPQDNSEAKDATVQTFHDYLWSEAAQKIFVRYGFRSIMDPLNSENSRFFELDSVFTLESLGGVSFARSELLENKWQNQIRPKRVNRNRTEAQP